MFRKLLIPLDGSALAEQALVTGTAIARGADATIDLVLVHDLAPFENIRQGPWGAPQWDEAHQYLTTVAAELGAGANVCATHGLRGGEPVELICERAAEVEADLIVMTSHGRTGLRRAWFGSVADGVMRSAKIPVLILRAHAGPADALAAQRRFKRILVPFDGTSTAIFPFAASLAACSGAELTLLRVVVPIPEIAMAAGVPYAYVNAVVDDVATQRCVEEAERHLADIARALSDETGVCVHSRVIVDQSVANAIIDQAVAYDADVVAMTTQSGPVARFFLGSIADKVVRGADRSVLLYRAAAGADLAASLSAEQASIANAG